MKNTPDWNELSISKLGLWNCRIILSEYFGIQFSQLGPSEDIEKKKVISAKHKVRSPNLTTQKKEAVVLVSAEDIVWVGLLET